MSSNPVQRNTNLSPFPIQTPMFQDLANNVKVGGPVSAKSASGVNSSGSAPPLSFAHTKWFQQAGVAINAAPQIQANVPASSTDSGDEGDLAYDGSYLYVCVAQNQWLRAPLSSF